MQIKKEIQNKISTLRNLPTLPHILVKLISECNKEDVNIVEVAGLVEKDPALSTKILKLVNSAFYGLPKKIETIQHSISYLGIGTIKNIAIGSSIHQTFRSPKGSVLFNMKIFWWHSLRCAVLARLLARETNYINPEEAFLTGLLHDIGRLVLWVNYPNEYSKLLEKHHGRPDLLLAGEIRQGATHCEIGAWLLHRWNLQPFMVDAVLYHHEPQKRIKNALSLVQIIWVANALSGQPDKTQEKDRDIGFTEDLCGLSPHRVEELLVQVDEEVDDVARLLGIEITPPTRKGDPGLENDLNTQRELAKEVRDTTLLLSTLQNLLEAHDEDAILREIHQGIQILFDLKDVFFFLYDKEKDCLTGKVFEGDEKYEAISGLFIPMQTENSLPVSCLLKKRNLELFIENTDDNTVLIDLQLIRFIGQEGIVCLPMLAHGEYVGAIVLGLSQMEFSHLSNHTKLLNMFTKQAALSLRADQMRRSPLKEIQTERAGASSDMARKVVHEVNNPLGIIKNYLKILGIKLSAQNIELDEIPIINKEIDRIAHILRSLTSFSENKGVNTGPVDVNAVLTDLVKITKESLLENSGIEVHLDLNEACPTVISDENSLKQVFINLIKNAAEAMEGGNIYIRTRYMSSYLDGVPAHKPEDIEGYVEVHIEDDGPGIPKEILSRLFDPFVTSKGSGHSGLGLSISHNLITALNGTLTCESDMGKGTIFTIGLAVNS